jgi:hypothetical protein
MKSSWQAHDMVNKGKVCDRNCSNEASTLFLLDPPIFVPVASNKKSKLALNWLEGMGLLACVWLQLSMPGYPEARMVTVMHAEWSLLYNGTGAGMRVYLQQY